MSVDIQQALLEKLYAVRPPSDGLPIVLFSECDPRILRAMLEIAAIGFAKPLLVGDEQAFLATCQQEGINPNDFSRQCQFVDIHHHPEFDALADRLYSLRKHKGLRKDDARKMAKEPLIAATLMLEMGQGDSLVSGAQNSTADVIRAALQIVGMKDGFRTLSSYFLMQQPTALIENTEIPSQLLLADCAINIEPSAEQLADIALATAENAKKLLNEPIRIALLSFSTNGSAQHSRVNLVRETCELIRSAQPELLVEGDMQLDAAIISNIQQQKFPNSALQGKPANVLVFPTLEAGNIGYKIMQRFGGSIAIGPILQGLKKPMNDLSRGCNMEDVVLTSILGCIACHMD